MFFEKNFKNDFDFFFFLETHHKDSNDLPNEILRYQDTHHIVHSEVDPSETHAGIIGLINKKYTLSEIDHIVQGRVVRVKIKDDTTSDSYDLAIVYLPTNQNLDQEYIRMVSRKLRTTERADTHYMILGDFNFIDHPMDKKNGLTSKDTNLCKVWVPFLEEMEMVDPFREQYANRRVWSFTGTGIAGNSRIDRVYVNSMESKNITNIRYINMPFHGHRVLSFSIEKENDWGQSYYKLNTSLFENEEHDKIVDESIAEINALTNRSNIAK